MTYFFDRNGNPLPLLVWAWLYEQSTYRNVARDVVVSTVDTSDALFVSTIWRGYDHDLAINLHPPKRPRAPLIYESAVLTGDNRIIANFPRANERDALRAHGQAVAWALDHLKVPVVIRHPVVPARPRGGWNTLPQRRYGRCQACERKVKLIAAGTTVNHGQRSRCDVPHCRGSHLRPEMQLAESGHDPAPPTKLSVNVHGG